MKKLLIASSICLPLMFLMGLVIPGTAIFRLQDGQINKTYFFICAVVYLIALSVVTATTMMMLRYTSYIDKIEVKEKKLAASERILDVLRAKYESLIGAETQKLKDDGKDESVSSSKETTS
jgi:hypothetical protein